LFDFALRAAWGGPVRIFKTRVFTRFARRVRLADKALREAVAEVERGLIHADLGSGVIKQRIARSGGGKSGGFRTIILYRAKSRAVFVYGFEKSGQDNIDDSELREFRRLAGKMLAYSDAEISTAIQSGAVIEVKYEEDQAVSQPDHGGDP
jgi:hypothetical protein